MRDEFREQLKEPRVVRHFPSVREEADLNANTHIFVEDASLGVMPIGGRLRQASNFSAEIQGRLDHKTRAIAILKSLTSRYRYNEQSLNELLGAAVAEVAYKLIWHGRAVHEIIRGVESNDAYLLHSFTPRRLFRFPRRYLQIVPKTDRGLWGKCCVIIPERDIWGITMPTVLGGCRGYLTMLRNLERFSHLHPSFLTDESGEQEWPAYLDLQRYVREAKLFESKVTARWGWGRRDATDRNWTEFYAIYRNVTFKWAQACMREHIAKELNRLFQRLNIEAKIAMEGLPTARKILDIRKQMCEGEISLSDAFDACSV